MDYPENTVGSLMSTDFFSFKESMTVDETLRELRRLKPEPDSIYYLYVLDKDEHLIATVSLRDLIIAEPHIKLSQIMNREVIKIVDTDKIDSLAELITKYNLIALPVVNKELKMEGMVIIDDVVYTLLKTRKKKTLREE
jgi:Mg/Co/Ni transporter MgtE (contains CBS domain)